MAHLDKGLKLYFPYKARVDYPWQGLRREAKLVRLGYVRFCKVAIIIFARIYLYFPRAR